MGNNIAKQDYDKFYQQYRDIKIDSYKLCDRKLETSEKYEYLLNHYKDTSVVFGVDKIYITYRYPIEGYKIGFSFPAELVFQEEVVEYEIDEIEMHTFKT